MSPTIADNITLLHSDNHEIVTIFTCDIYIYNHSTILAHGKAVACFSNHTKDNGIQCFGPVTLNNELKFNDSWAHQEDD